LFGGDIAVELEVFFFLLVHITIGRTRRNRRGLEGERKKVECLDIELGVAVDTVEEALLILGHHHLMSRDERWNLSCTSIAVGVHHGAGIWGASKKMIQRRKGRAFS
jgi:hypothetical protein